MTKVEFSNSLLNNDEFKSKGIKYGDRIWLLVLPSDIEKLAIVPCKVVRRSDVRIDNQWKVSYILRRPVVHGLSIRWEDTSSLPDIIFETKEEAIKAVEHYVHTVMDDEASWLLKMTKDDQTWNADYNTGCCAAN